MFPNINRHGIVRGFSVFLTFFLITLAALISIYEKQPGSGINMPYWYNAVYAVRVVMCLAMIYTSYRIWQASVHEGGGERLAFALHYSLFMLITCCVVYFDPSTTAILATKNPNDFTVNCKRSSIAYLIMVIIYAAVYTLSEIAGENKPEEAAAAPAEEEAAPEAEV